MRFSHVPDALRKAPFTTATAGLHGVSPTALKGPSWRHIFRNVWAHVDLPDTREVRLAAVALVLPEGAFVCGLTPAWLYGIDVQDRRSDLIWVGSHTGRKLRARAGCYRREITVSDDDLAIHDGLLMTNPLRTAFDCGRWLRLVEATVVADALSHAELITVSDLAHYLATHRRLRGVVQLETVIDLMEPKSESPMETRLRLLLVLAGLPRPEAQFNIFDERDRFVARADFAYVAARVVVEYDGAHHFAQRAADDRRREEMRDIGWDVLVFSREDYYDTPDLTIARVRRALAKTAPRE